MGKPYKLELQQLEETFKWAATTDNHALYNAIEECADCGVTAVGSGGSLSTAIALADMHQQWTGYVSNASTTMQSAVLSLAPQSKVWLLSAGGGNVDIQNVLKNSITFSYKNIFVLCGKKDSTLSVLSKNYSCVTPLVYQPPTGKDGFLATNSLLAFVVLLVRTYSEIFGTYQIWKDSYQSIFSLFKSDMINAWHRETKECLDRQTIAVLYGPQSRIGGIELESKFTEAALGNIQLADYRNFAHGRHHWLAKRGNSSSIIAFYSKSEQMIAEKTVNLIPSNIPTARIFLPFEKQAVPIASLIASLYITSWAGDVCGIDPGRPGVPIFGRKLYNLTLPNDIKPQKKYGLSLRQQAAIVRKSRNSIERLAAKERLQYWIDAYTAYVSLLSRTNFGGIVFDYDGTLVDTQNRLLPPNEIISDLLNNILNNNIAIAFASGRGRSLRVDLQKIINERYWDNIILGYYNGSVTGKLSDDTIPGRTTNLNKVICDIARTLSSDKHLSRFISQENREEQITVTLKEKSEAEYIYEYIFELLGKRIQTNDFKIKKSGHSLDITTGNTSKDNIIKQMYETVENQHILAIGDQGYWYGNDYELLASTLSLSVDTTSISPLSCWNLGQPGQKGTIVTQDYLSAIQFNNGTFKLAKALFK